MWCMVAPCKCERKMQLVVVMVRTEHGIIVEKGKVRLPFLSFCSNHGGCIDLHPGRG